MDQILDEYAEEEEDVDEGKGLHEAEVDEGSQTDDEEDVQGEGRVEQGSSNPYLLRASRLRDILSRREAGRIEGTGNEGNDVKPTEMETEGSVDRSPKE